jgi:hypothetical protein
MSDRAPIQFDQAEFKDAQVPATCSSCGAGIHAVYYQVGQSIVCERCRRQLQFDATSGSPVGRFVKAALLGGLAGAVGAGLYYGVRALTGYEFGLIAIVVGLLVGGAVRMGSAHRGGVPYQLLAMFLTYASIVSTYIPDIIQGFREQNVAEEATPAPGTAPAAGEVAAAAPATGPASAVPATAAAAPSAMGPVVVLLALAAVVAIAFAAPFLMGFQNAIGIVIIAIGLYEAWKINRKPDRTVTGPFRIQDAAVPEPAPAP